MGGQFKCDFYGNLKKRGGALLLFSLFSFSFPLRSSRFLYLVMLESLCNSLSCEHFIFLICRFDDLFPHLGLVELVEMGAIGISKDQSDQRFLCRLSSLLNLSYVFFISYHTKSSLRGERCFFLFFFVFPSFSSFPSPPSSPPSPPFSRSCYIRLPDQQLRFQT